MIKLKHTLFSILLVLILNSCSVSEAPEFVGLTNFKTNTIDINTILVESDIIFFNPNDIGCVLEGTDLDVLVNGVDVGKATQTKDIYIEDNRNFHLPVLIKFSPKEVFKKNSGILGGILTAISSKKVDVQYIGSVTLSIGGIPFEIDIDETQEVPLNIK